MDDINTLKWRIIALMFEIPHFFNEVEKEEDQRAYQVQVAKHTPAKKNRFSRKSSKEQVNQHNELPTVMSDEEIANRERCKRLVSECKDFLPNLLRAVEVPEFTVRFSREKSGRVKDAINQMIMALEGKVDYDVIARINCFKQSLSTIIDEKLPILTFSKLSTRFTAFNQYHEKKKALLDSKARWSVYLVGLFCYACGVLTVHVLAGLSLLPYVLPSLIGGTVLPVTAIELYYGLSGRKIKTEFDVEITKIVNSNGRSRNAT